MVLDCSPDEINLVACGELRDRILSLLGNCDKIANMEVIPKALSLCALTVQIYQELSEKQINPDIAKYFDIILTYITVRNHFL